MSFCKNVTTLVCVLILCCATKTVTGEDADFEAHKKKIDEQAAALLTEGLRHVVRYDALPATDGWFGDYVELLCALHPRKEHLPDIIKLIEKSDPHLQEAGVELATASVEKLNDYTGLEKPLCALLQNPNLDPWVLRAITKFVRASTHPRSVDLFDFYRTFAAVAYGKKVERVKHTGINRSMFIDPYKDAKDQLDQVMLNSSQATNRSDAILPYLEKAYGTKGWEETYKVVMKKVTRVK